MRFLFLPAVKGCNLSAKTNHCRHAHERVGESWGLWTSSDLRVPGSSDAVQTGDNKIEGVLVVLLNTV
jgi:hypothetical protein